MKKSCARQQARNMAARLTAIVLMAGAARAQSPGTPPSNAELEYALNSTGLYVCVDWEGNYRITDHTLAYPGDNHAVALQDAKGCIEFYGSGTLVFCYKANTPSDWLRATTSNTWEQDQDVFGNETVWTLATMKFSTLGLHKVFFEGSNVLLDLVVWDPLPIPVTVSFDAHGGSACTNVVVSFGKPYGDVFTGSTRPDYTFLGWFKTPAGGEEVTPASIVGTYTNHTLHAQWRYNKVIVDFNAHGGTPCANVEVWFGDEYGPLPEPSLQDHAFLGWFTAETGGDLVTPGSIVVDYSDHTLHAQWKDNRVTVDFDPRGGSPVDPETHVFTETYGTLPETTLQYHTFLGWFTAKTGGIPVTNESFVVADTNHTLYAQWKDNRVTVDFDPRGGSDADPILVLPGEKYGELPVTTRDDYTFRGWFTADGDHITPDSIVAIVTNHTLHADWRCNGVYVSFNTHGGPAIEKIFVWFGGAYGDLPAPILQDHSFLGWFTDETGGDLVTPGSIVVDYSDHILHARWKDNHVTVSFNAHDGSGVDPILVLPGNKYGPLPIPTRPHYTFLGWFTTPAGNNQITSESTVNLAASHTLHAQWRYNGVIVSFDAHGGTACTNVFVWFGGEYGELPETTLDDHTFLGWFAEETGGTQTTNASIVADYLDHTLHAQWRDNHVTVDFDPRGGSDADPILVLPGEKYGELPATTRDDYTFSGWFTADGDHITPDSIVAIVTNHTLHADWRHNGVYVSFNTHGGPAIEKIFVWFGGAYGDLPAPILQDHTFLGWFTEQTGGDLVTPASIVENHLDHTLHAQWRDNHVTVSFNAQGGSPATSSKTVVTGSAYGSLPAPTRPDHKFLGWFTAAAGGTPVTAATTVTLGADHVLYAQWRYNIVTVSFDTHGGTPANPQTVVADEPYGAALPATTLKDHKFLGWFTAAAGGDEITSDSPVETYADHTLHAQWLHGLFELEEALNSTGLFTCENWTGSHAITIGSAARDGKHAVALNDARGEIVFYGSGTLTFHYRLTSIHGVFSAIADDAWDKMLVKHGAVTPWTQVAMTFTTLAEHRLVVTGFDALLDQVVWNPDPFPVTVTFDSDGGSFANAKAVVMYGKNYGAALPATIKAGHAFLGWHADKNNGGGKITASDIVAIPADHTLCARWTTNTFAVIFNANGGAPANQTRVQTFGHAYDFPPSPALPGHTFLGWFGNSEGSGNPVTPATPVSEKRVFYAKWVQTGWGQFPAAHPQADGPGTITMSPANGQVVNGKPVTLTAKPAKDALFVDWSNGAATPSIKVAPGEDTLYVARFRYKADCADPVVESVAQPANSMVGVAFEMRVRVNDQARPVKFSASNLPAGLKINASSGVISGVPARAGAFFPSVKAASVANGKKSTSVILPTLAIAPLPAAAQGVFNGWVEDNTGVRGSFTATVSSLGKITAKVVSAGGASSFSAPSWAGRDANGVFNARLETTRGQALALTLDAGKSWDTPQMSGALDGLGGVVAQRNPFLNKNNAAALDALRGYYTLAFTGAPVDGSWGLALNIPEGHGHLTASVGANGNVKLSGKLANGAAVSAAATLMVEGGGAIVSRFIPLNNSRGFVSGWFGIREPAKQIENGEWQWHYPGKTPAGKTPATEDRFTLSLAPMGGFYSPLASLAAFYAEHPVRPPMTSFTANAKTGLFNGKINHHVETTGKTLSLSHNGVLLQSGGAVHTGRGYYLVPEKFGNYTIQRSHPVVIE